MRSRVARTFQGLFGAAMDQEHRNCLRFKHTECSPRTLRVNMRSRVRGVWAFSLVWVALGCLDLADGEQHVCFRGYIMDTYCIDRGTLLDNSGLQTLEHPDKHSVKCLLMCSKKGYEILVRRGNGTAHCRAAKFDAEGNQRAMEFARKVGGEEGVLEGLNATVKGTLHFDSTYSLPVLKVLSIGSYSDTGCEDVGGPTVMTTCWTESGRDQALVLAHGSLMMLSWGILLPLGACIAYLGRYRDPMWFIVHRAVQGMGLSLALSGFLIAVTQFNVFSHDYSPMAKAHGSMGIGVMSLGLFQPLTRLYISYHENRGSVLKPSPGERGHRRIRRQDGTVSICRNCHMRIGRSAVCCAVPTIILGTLLVGEHSHIFQFAYAVFAMIMITVFLLHAQRPLW